MNSRRISAASVKSVTLGREIQAEGPCFNAYGPVRARPPGPVSGGTAGQRAPDDDVVSAITPGLRRPPPRHTAAPIPAPGPGLPAPSPYSSFRLSTLMVSPSITPVTSTSKSSSFFEALMASRALRLPAASNDRNFWSQVNTP